MQVVMLSITTATRTNDKQRKTGLNFNHANTLTYEKGEKDRGATNKLTNRKACVRGEAEAFGDE